LSTISFEFFIFKHIFHISYFTIYFLQTLGLPVPVDTENFKKFIKFAFEKMGEIGQTEVPGTPEGCQELVDKLFVMWEEKVN